jgi:hypothetical protein
MSRAGSSKDSHGDDAEQGLRGHRYWATEREKVVAPAHETRQFVMEPGPVEVSAGSSSNDIRSTARFTVTGKRRVISGQERAFLSVATVGS